MIPANEEERKDLEALEIFYKKLADLTPDELMMLMSSSRHIDGKMLWEEVEFYGWDPEAKIPKFFAQFLKDKDSDQFVLRRLLRYVTGVASIPFGGFERDRKIKIKKCEGDKIIAHTCFSRLDVPEFDDYEIFKTLLESELAELDSLRFKD